jgi:hypothetical protein
MVSGYSAGYGSLLSSVPESDARNLAAALTTVKANLGFQELQKMREMSPTGGALGQVAVQELVALQSTIESLEQGQSPDQLKANLAAVDKHLSNWSDAMQKAYEAEYGTPGINPLEQGGKTIKWDEM